jgi:hypothetical protein
MSSQGDNGNDKLKEGEWVSLKMLKKNYPN